MTEIDHTFARKREEHARAQKRLQPGEVRPGIARELRKQLPVIEREIAKLERGGGDGPRSGLKPAPVKAPAQC